MPPADWQMRSRPEPPAHPQIQPNRLQLPHASHSDRGIDDDHEDDRDRHDSIAKSPSTAIIPSTLDMRLERQGLAVRHASQSGTFHTPINNFFYSKYRYMPLDPKRSEIRLLRVFPRKSYLDHITDQPAWKRPITAAGLPIELESDAMSTFMTNILHLSHSQRNSPIIACEILDKTALARKDGQYCTLSYCAGSPSKTALILVDGYPFNAFENLEHAMDNALACWSARNPQRELLLWVDQICINQQDLDERANQVKLMKEIYRRSNETFVCLSNPQLSGCLDWVPQDVQATTRAIQDASSAITNADTEAAQLLDPVSDLKKDLRKALLQPRMAVGHYSSGRSVDPTNQTKELDAWLANFRNFLSSPWWRRAWIFQEYVLSSRPFFLSESKSVFCDQIVPLIEFIGSELVQYLDSLAYELDAKVQEKVAKYEESKRRYDEEMRIYDARMSEYQAVVEEEWLQNLQEQNIMRGQYVEQRAGQLEKRGAELEEKKSQANPLDLVERWRLGRQETGLNALKGSLVTTLTRQGYEDALPVDSQLWHQALKPGDWVFSERDLSVTKDILRLTESRDGRTVSGSYVMISGRDRKDIREQRDRLKHLNSTPKDPQSFQSMKPPPQKPTPLPAEAVPVQEADEWHNRKGRIASLQEHIKGLDAAPIGSVLNGRVRKMGRKADLKQLLSHSRNCLSSDDRDRVYAFLGLGHRGYAISPMYSAQNTIIHVLLETAKQILIHDRSLDLLEYVNHGRDRLGHLLPSWVPDWTSKYEESGLEEYVAMCIEMHGKRPFCASKSSPWTPEFHSDENDMSNLDLKVRGTLVDIIDDTAGQVEGFPRLSQYMLPDGRQVVAVSTVLEEDQVWVLHGSSKPVVLRPEICDDNAFAYISNAVIFASEGDGGAVSSPEHHDKNCCLSKIMFGEELGNKPVAEIWLH